MLTAISPIDGRYFIKTLPLQEYFSESALIKYRVVVEIKYLQALKNQNLPQLQSMTEEQMKILLSIIDQFDDDEAQKIKDIEKITNHDVKAVEYYIKDKMQAFGLDQYLEFVHFGLTSQDINNTANPMMIRDAMNHVLIPEIQKVVTNIKAKAKEYRGIPMLARTHGQPASPTTLGKEMEVFIERIDDQLQLLSDLPIKAKFGGATGNFNAHKITYPEINWIEFGNQFVGDYLGLERSQKTTQIAHYDHLAAIFDNLRRINNIFIDFCRDIWTYISMEYFGQKVIAGEVGSSAMPHKVNPIDFENAEGNLGMANAILIHLSNKLPISRLQRDLTDSTVLRNVGVPFGHMLIAMKSIAKGLGKLLLRKEILNRDLEQNWAVLAEAIQNILRREGYPKPYETLKSLTRGNNAITKESILTFIDNLEVSEKIKHEMRQLTPQNYVGYF